MASIENSHENAPRFNSDRGDLQDHQQIQEWNIEGVAGESAPWPNENAAIAINLFGTHNLIGGSSPTTNQYY